MENMGKFLTGSAIRPQPADIKIFLTFFKKPIDKPPAIVYNIIRSGEERKTLGPTANLPIFKLYIKKHTNSAGRSDSSVPSQNSAGARFSVLKQKSGSEMLQKYYENFILYS